MADSGASDGGGSTSAAGTSTSAAGAFQAMGSKMQSFSPGGQCSFPSRITSLTVFQRPKQRQRWGDKQVLPHTNWGDLFFDLFYVAAAYNLSNIILTDPNAQGVLYFIGLFGPIMAEWFTRMYYDSRFAFGDDPFHRLFEVINLCFLATAVVHIRTVDVMSNPSQYPDMFAYALGMTLLSFMSICRNIELMLFVEGEPAAKIVAKRDIINQIGQGIFYLAAAVVAGTQYHSNFSKANSSGGSASDYGYGHDDSQHRFLLGTSGLCSNMMDLIGNVASTCGLRIRNLAEASDYGSKVSAENGYGYDGGYSTTNIPLWLCLGGYLYNMTHFLVMVIFFFPGGGKHKAISVPMNIDFCIHRLGEWIMLLLGESVLSLLIVETSMSKDYYITFYCGIISVVLLQYLHFRSQPHHASEHAMRRNKNAGMVFSYLMQTYSFALVSVGVSFKMLLYEFIYEANGGYKLRRLLQLLRDSAMRHLAGEGGPKYSTDERQQRVANFFCGSLAIAWICLDLMILTHQGLRSNVRRCECQITKKISKLGVLFAFIRVGLVAFIASLSQYVKNPELIAIIGMVAIIAQVFMRVLGDMIYPKAKVASAGDGHGDGDGDGDDGSESDSEEDRWPNVTRARAEHVDGKNVKNDKDEERGD